MYLYTCLASFSHVHVLMRDEKEGRKKQGRSNKQQGKATQHTQGSHFPKKNELPQMYIHVHPRVCALGCVLPPHGDPEIGCSSARRWRLMQ